MPGSLARDAMQSSRHFDLQPALHHIESSAIWHESEGLAGSYSETLAANHMDIHSDHLTVVFHKVFAILNGFIIQYSYTVSIVSQVESHGILYFDSLPE
jgi:hypothetical protein